MRYMMLIYTQENAAERMSPEEMENVKATHWTVMDEARQKGIFQGAEPLKPTSTATTVRVQDGKAFTTDGPSPRPRSSSRDTTSWIARTWTTPSSGLPKFQVRAAALPVALKYGRYAV